MPAISRILRRIIGGLISRKPFKDSASYWQERYKSGGTSGAGSYDELAQIKADIINDFVADKNIRTVIEHGCGDGNQLKYAKYDSYTGFDVSSEAIAICRKKFSRDQTKTFKHNDEYSSEVAELSLSLDVIYHLVEDDVYKAYMDRLFSSASKFVIIYSSNAEGGETMEHVRHRQFSDYVKKNYPEWTLSKILPNEYLMRSHDLGEFSPYFFIYERHVKQMPSR